LNYTLDDMASEKFSTRTRSRTQLIKVWNCCISIINTSLKTIPMDIYFSSLFIIFSIIVTPHFRFLIRSIVIEPACKTHTDIYAGYLAKILVVDKSERSAARRQREHETYTIPTP
jgi:hypothetical protein